MTIHLSKELERFVHDAVRACGYATEDDVVNDAVARLQQTMPKTALTTGRGAERAKAAPPKLKRPLTPAELDQYMLKIGLLSQLPDTDADFDDPDDEPVTIKGEPLSETVIRERR